MQFFDEEESVEILSPTAEMMPVFDAVRESFERLAALPHANALSLAWDDISFTQTGTELARWYFGRNGLSIRIEDPDDAMLGDLYHWVENHFNVMSEADVMPRSCDATMRAQVAARSAVRRRGHSIVCR